MIESFIWSVNSKNIPVFAILSEHETELWLFFQTYGLSVLHIRDYAKQSAPEIDVYNGLWRYIPHSLMQYRVPVNYLSALEPLYVAYGHTKASARVVHWRLSYKSVYLLDV